MVMSHIYQPVMIKTLVKSNNTASVTKIAKEFLSKDQSQIDYYKEETKNMVGRVLKTKSLRFVMKKLRSMRKNMVRKSGSIGQEIQELFLDH